MNQGVIGVPPWPALHYVLSDGCRRVCRTEMHLVNPAEPWLRILEDARYYPSPRNSQPIKVRPVDSHSYEDGNGDRQLHIAIQLTQGATSAAALDRWEADLSHVVARERTT